MSTQLQTIRESFFNTVFSLLGHIANCDGYINRNEIKRIEIYMQKMNLSEKCKREAQHLFREGSSPRFNISQVLKEFSKTSTPNLIQILLVYLISMARTDGLLVKKEMQVVQKVASELGYSSIVFDHLLKMISAQDDLTPKPSTKEKNQGYQQKSQQEKYQHHNNSSTGSGYKNQNASNMDLAFEALGVTKDMSEDDIKRAYQKLVSQYHPDKLVGQGMPPDLVNAATERFKKIQAAYEYIKKYHHLTAVA